MLLFHFSFFSSFSSSLPSAIFCSALFFHFALLFSFFLDSLICILSLLLLSSCCFFVCFFNSLDILTSVSQYLPYLILIAYCETFCIDCSASGLNTSISFFLSCKHFRVLHFPSKIKKKKKMTVGDDSNLHW
jgi:hypothetical protein